MRRNERGVYGSQNVSCVVIQLVWRQQCQNCIMANVLFKKVDLGRMQTVVLGGVKGINAFGLYARKYVGRPFYQIYFKDKFEPF